MRLVLIFRAEFCTSSMERCFETSMSVVSSLILFDGEIKELNTFNELEILQSQEDT